MKWDMQVLAIPGQLHGSAIGFSRGVAVRISIGKCLKCKKRNAPVGKQLMADLPSA